MSRDAQSFQVGSIQLINSLDSGYEISGRHAGRIVAHYYFPDGHRSNQRSPESMDCRSLLPNTILLAPVTLHTIFYATRKGARH